MGLRSSKSSFNKPLIDDDTESGSFKQSRLSRTACQTTMNELTATDPVYHYTTKAGFDGIKASGKIKASGAQANFGKGVYGTKKCPGFNSKKGIIENNYGNGFRGQRAVNNADYAFEVKVPRGEAESVASQQPPRDIRIVSEKDYKLTGQERKGSFEEMKNKSIQYSLEDAAVETGKCAVMGAAIGGGVATLYAVTDLAKGKIGAVEAGQQIGAGAGVGAVVGAVGKVADVVCQRGAGMLAAKECVQAASCARRAVPGAGAALGVCVAAYNFKEWSYAGSKGDSREKGKEAAASGVEAVCGVASTVAFLALEASGPVGWGILGAGLLTGWGIRSFA